MATPQRTFILISNTLFSVSTSVLQPAAARTHFEVIG